MTTRTPACVIVWLQPDLKRSLPTWWSPRYQSLHWKMTSGDKWRQVKPPLTRRQVNYSLLRHFKDILKDWIGYRRWLMSSHSLPPVDFNKWRVVIHFLTSLPPPPINQCYFRFPLRRGVFPGRLTGGAGPVRHPGDEPLLFAGRLSPVALVLVGVSVGAAHGDVVFVALEIKHNQMLIKRLKVTAAAHRNKQLRTWWWWDTSSREECGGFSVNDGDLTKLKIQRLWVASSSSHFINLQ